MSDETDTDAPPAPLIERLPIKPYFRNHRCALFHGDCREILPALPPNEFDLMVADPPYGQNFESNYRHKKWGPIIGDDGSLDILACLALALTRCTWSAHVYVFGPADLSALKLTNPVELVWDKAMMSGGDLELPYGKSHEYIQFAINATKQTKVRGKLAARKRRGTVIKCQRPNATGCRHHPTEKPVMLLRQLIECSSVFDECILDPFAGSGSTLVAAQLEQRYAIGIELEERHCETTAERLEELGELSL